MANVPDRADGDRGRHRRAVVRDRRAEFERRLAERELVCTCRRPDAIDPIERCARCYARPDDSSFDHSAEAVAFP